MSTTTTNTNVFLNASKECRNSEALWRIRRAAWKQSDSKREDDFHHEQDDGEWSQLLPTIARLRRAFSEAELGSLLQCDCLLCADQRKHEVDDDDDAREQSPAREILQNDNKLKAFAVLVLAGCLFAWAEFSKRSDDLDSFSKRVKGDSPASAELRRRLFKNVTVDAEECAHDAHAKRSLRRQCADCAGSTFRDCVRAKKRLLQIPVLRRLNEIQEFDEFDNLPFVQEDQDQLDNQRPTVRFWKCRIEPTHCSSDELKSHELFRKRYRFSPEDRGVQNAMKEARVALSLGSLDHDNIAKVLLAFREEDSDYTYVNLVFKREQHTLEDYFRQPALASFLGGFRGRLGVHTVVLDHGLWKALSGIVDAVATIHEVVKGTVQPKRSGPTIWGHFDIKPANILIEEGGNLLLTDFGQAAMRSIGTSDFAPPEHENNLRFEPVNSYDTWSLACVLLQALVFIAALADGDDAAGARALDTFYSNRINQTTRNRAGAFWIRDEETKILRKAVTEELKRLEARRHHQTQVVVSQLRNMFEINPADRPAVRSCFKKFKAGLGRDVFRIAGDRIVEPKLAEWITSFTTEVQHDPIPCRLYLYITRGQPREINLTLEYEGEPSTHSRTDIRRIDHAMFIPVSFYESMEPVRRRRHSDTSRETSVPLSCAFENLFRGITLFFHRADDYFEFMTLTTHQQLLPDVRTDRSLSGATMRLKKFILTEKRIFLRPDKTHTFESGAVQVWRRLADAAYKERYEHGEESLDQGFQRALPVGARGRVVPSPLSQMSMYKLALFGSEDGLAWCVVVDIGFRSYNIKTSPMRFDFIQDGEGAFNARIYRSTAGYPGFPFSPDVLDKDIQGENGIKIRKLELNMQSDQGDQDFQTLRGILLDQGFRLS